MDMLRAIARLRRSGPGLRFEGTRLNCGSNFVSPDSGDVVRTSGGRVMLLSEKLRLSLLSFRLEADLEKKRP